ncbi:MAG TPA: ATPase, T2SS/T4P/T4SS family [Bacillota bacterium]|nr:ATPase, T2SS/T4P/T4SS family [Bacillota bacterium]
MFKLFNLLKPTKSKYQPPQELQEQQDQIEFLDLKEAAPRVREELIKDDKLNRLFEEAMAGVPGAKEQIITEIIKAFENLSLSINGLTPDEAAEEIYRKNWGLDVVEAAYRDPTVDEIRVNDKDHVYVTRRGRRERLDVSFESEEAVEVVIKRMILHDVGVSLNETSPRVESVRKDGSRLTALCSPVSKTWSFVLRKHFTFEMTPENLERNGTLGMNVWELLRMLVTSGVSILFCGPVESGKTSLLRRLLKELNTVLRVVVLEKDRELSLSSYDPDRDVLELEEHVHLGASLKSLFETILRLTPDIIVVQEFRGSGEAVEAVRACTRTMRGAFATAHFVSPEEAVEGAGLMMLEEGLNIPLELAMLRVARAFNVVVQMVADSARGIKKVVRVTELLVDDKKIKYNDLCVWKPETNDYLGKGSWVFVNMPSEKLLNKMAVFNTTEEEVNRLWESMR